MTSKVSGEFVRWDEAMQLVRSVSDKRTRTLLNRVVGAVGIHHARRDINPSQAFDMAYCVGILEEVSSEHEDIAAVLEGRRPTWTWFDDE